MVNQMISTRCTAEATQVPCGSKVAGITWWSWSNGFKWTMLRSHSNAKVTEANCSKTIRAWLQLTRNNMSSIACLLLCSHMKTEQKYNCEPTWPALWLMCSTIPTPKSRRFREFLNRFASLSSLSKLWLASGSWELARCAQASSTAIAGRRSWGGICLRRRRRRARSAASPRGISAEGKLVRKASTWIRKNGWVKGEIYGTSIDCQIIG